ncbi:hypothetical protein [uncultured Herbaspirillum sp.]|uniref:hypothetical protein n=1 Tax=uncultured Herbaspirillum sp. TaxID=160236 RepID=UPI002586875B|nr:hypothetical protein [uncultured Herbaspirillum sp.]
MLIKSSGFPLLKIRIAKNEYLPGYMLNQILYGARGKAQEKFADHTADVLTLSWRHITNVKDLVARSDLNLPSLDECIMGHTLFPYFAWSMPENDREKLYEQYVHAKQIPEEKKIWGHTKGTVRGPILKSRTGLLWCAQCAESQTSGAQSWPFPIWHRLHFAPNVLLCHIHKIPLSTFCDTCRDRDGVDQSNWIPALQCLCPQKKLKDRAPMSAAMLHAMSEIVSKANEILQGETPPEFNPLAIKNAVRKRFPNWRKGEGTRTDSILKAIAQNIDKGAAELLQLNGNTILSFTGGEGQSRLRNPIHILTIGYAAFNGFDGLMETINGSSKWISPRRESDPSKTRRQSAAKYTKKAEFKEFVATIQLDEREKLQQAGRAWLLERLTKNPDLSRKDFWTRNSSRTNKYKYLVWIDADWLREQIPSSREVQSKERIAASYGSRVEITATMIYERHAIEIRENPFRKITKKTLMRPLDTQDIITLEYYSPEIKDALKNCIDDSDTWKLRAAKILSSMIAQRFPNHHYADINWYLGITAKMFEARFSKAKKWFFNPKNQH